MTKLTSQIIKYVLQSLACFHLHSLFFICRKRSYTYFCKTMRLCDHPLSHYCCSCSISYCISRSPIKQNHGSQRRGLRRTNVFLQLCMRNLRKHTTSHPTKRSNLDVSVTFPVNLWVRAFLPGFTARECHEETGTSLAVTWTKHQEINKFCAVAQDDMKQVRYQPPESFDSFCLLSNFFIFGVLVCLRFQTWFPNFCTYVWEFSNGLLGNIGC